jgi:hypothetical protein
MRAFQLERLPVTPSTRRFTAAERVRLALEIAHAYWRVRWWLFRSNLPAVVATARQASTPQRFVDGEPRAIGVRLGRAVARTLRPLPFDSRCLVTALVLTRLLATRGIESTLVLGVRTKPDFAAHAWVERDGEPLLPTGRDFHRLTEL